MPNPTETISAPRIAGDVAAIYAHARRCDYRGINGAAREIAARLQLPGVQTEVIRLPADGRTFFGGWVMPKAWDVTSAVLSVVSPDVPEPVLADYRSNPHSLMMWSPPTPTLPTGRDFADSTPDGGVEGQAVLVKDIFHHRGSLAGKFVLLDRMGQLGVDAVAEAARRGAAAVLSDHVIEARGIKEGPYLNGASQYHNYAVAPWDGPQLRGRGQVRGRGQIRGRIPGFSLTRGDGRRLRQMLARGPVRLKAVVRSRLYDGVTPLVSARLPGKSSQEIVLTAHMDEPGASDNASGAAVCMEVLRVLAARVKKTGQPLARTVHVLLSSEVRGIQAYINLHRPKGKPIAGLDLDMVGYDHTDGRTKLKIIAALPAAASYVEFLLGELAAQEARRSPRFEWKTRRGIVVNDCHWAAPPRQAKMCELSQHPDRTYHTSLDRPECLSTPHLGRMGRMVLTATAFLAGAGYPEVRGLAERIYKQGLADLRQKDGTARDALRYARQRWVGLDQLAPPAGPPLYPEQLAKANRSQLFVDGYLYPQHELQQAIRRWDEQLTRRAGKRVRRPAKLRVGGKLLADLRRLVPIKQYLGYFAFEDLAPRQRRQLTAQTGLAPGWGAPGWLQYALDLSTGKRSLEDICLQLAADDVAVDPATLVKTMRFLQRRGKVTFNRVLDKADLVRALRRVGVARGDIVVFHTSLSAFGYVRGGAQTYIDALRAVIGPRGTMAMPTHSLNWVGRPPYDPARSPAFIGAVADCLLAHPDAVRSLHPTHSVVAVGPAARDLVKGHDPTCTPVGREGFWGNFYRANGKVVMMCKLGSNTFFHAVDLWAGVPYPSIMAHYLKNGRRIEFAEHSAPGHTTSFPKIYAALKRRGQLRAAPLGKSTIYCLRAQDAVEAGRPILRRDPLLATAPGCNCWYCIPVRVAVARQKAQRRRRRS